MTDIYEDMTDFSSGHEPEEYRRCERCLGLYEETQLYLENGKLCCDDCEPIMPRVVAAGRMTRNSLDMRIEVDAGVVVTISVRR